MTTRAIRLSSTLGLIAGIPLLVMACSLLPQRQGERTPTDRVEQSVAVRHIAQMDFGQDAFFAVCTEPACPAVTRKFLAIASRIATMSMLTAAPSHAGVPQFIANRAGAHSAERYEVIVPFMSGSATLTSSGKAAITRALPEVRQANRIVISGHTDSVGANALNQRLALQRAFNVRRYLRQREPALHAAVVTEARGRCCFIASNDTPQGRRQNRRVEVVFSVPGQVTP